MSDLLSTKGYKGTRDFYPDDMKLRNWFFGKMRDVVESYGYEEMDGPILESFDLFAAKSGEEIVNEQIYNFCDKKDRRVAIRPEMTPTVARMLAAKLEEFRLPLRWYSVANFMRYERPQKGRLREFYQLNIDLLGVPDIRADVEMIAVIVDLMKSFGADKSMFKIKIGNRRFFNDVLTDVLGVKDDEVKLVSKAVDKRSKISREQYIQWLADSGIDEAKSKKLDEIFEASLDDIKSMLTSETPGAKELTELFAYLTSTGLDEYCEFDFSIVRGFDYYTGTIFEVYDEDPSNRRALFGGGRYDNLVGLFKKQEVSGIGFGFGDVTFQNFLEGHNLIPDGITNANSVLITVFDDVDYTEYLKLAAELRNANINSAIYLGDSTKLGKQFRYAEKMNYTVALVLGADELATGEIVVKDLVKREQETVKRDVLVGVLKK